VCIGGNGTAKNNLRLAKAGLNIVMLPKTIEVLEHLPKTSSGKVDYPALRRRTGS